MAHLILVLDVPDVTCEELQKAVHDWDAEEDDDPIAVDKVLASTIASALFAGDILYDFKYRINEMTDRSCT
jgi:hypothetical protein